MCCLGSRLCGWQTRRDAANPTRKAHTTLVRLHRLALGVARPRRRGSSVRFSCVYLMPPSFGSLVWSLGVVYSLDLVGRRFVELLYSPAGGRLAEEALAKRATDDRRWLREKLAMQCAFDRARSEGECKGISGPPFGVGKRSRVQQPPRCDPSLRVPLYRGLPVCFHVCVCVCV